MSSSPKQPPFPFLLPVLFPLHIVQFISITIYLQVFHYLFTKILRLWVKLLIGHRVDWAVLVMAGIMLIGVLAIMAMTHLITRRGGE